MKQKHISRNFIHVLIQNKAKCFHSMSEASHNSFKKTPFSLNWNTPIYCIYCPIVGRKCVCACVCSFYCSSGMRCHSSCRSRKCVCSNYTLCSVSTVYLSVQQQFKAQLDDDSQQWAHKHWSFFSCCYHKASWLKPGTLGKNAIFKKWSAKSLLTKVNWWVLLFVRILEQWLYFLLSHNIGVLYRYFFLSKYF